MSHCPDCGMSDMDGGCSHPKCGLQHRNNMRAALDRYGQILLEKRLREIEIELGIPVATLAGLRDGSLVAVPRPTDWDMGAGRHPFSAVTLHYDDDAKVAQAANAINDLLAAAPEAPGRG